MKDKIIKIKLNEKKTITSIFLIVPAIALLAVATLLILFLFDTEIRNSNLEVLKETILLFGGIGVFGIGFTIYFTKFTNKLNAIKIPKEELEELYDKIIDEKVIDDLESGSDELRKEYDNIKKSAPKMMIGTIGIIIVCCILIYIFGSKLNDIAISVISLILMCAIIYFALNISMSLKSSEKLVQEFKENLILDIFSDYIQERNKEITKENNKIEKENNNRKIKKNNPLLFWFIEILLALWIVAVFNKEVLEIIETDGIYGVIAICIIAGFPAFFFFRNIYVRYIKK